MTILELALAAYGVYNAVGTTTSIIGGSDVVLKHFKNSTAEHLFKKSFVNAVKQHAPHLAHFTETSDPKTVSVDNDTLNNIITSLKDIDISTLTSLEKNDKLIKITALFRKCIILPGHQLPDTELDQKTRPVLEHTITDFYSRLPFKQGAFNQVQLEFEYTKQAGLRTLLGDTDELKKTTRELKSELTDLSNKSYNANAVATDHKLEIDNARDLLKKGRPQSALELLENLKQQIWTNASEIARFRILTNMAEAQFALNMEREGAMLLLEAFQYNPEEEIALSNRALAHFLLEETEKASDSVKKTLEKNPVNTSAYVIRVAISTDEETLEEVIDKVPEYLRETPQIAHAISEVARQRQNFEEAKKWGEIMVANEQENVSNCKAALAAILVQQVLDDRVAALTNQLNDSQKEQLRRAIGDSSRKHGIALPTPNYAPFGPIGLSTEAQHTSILASRRRQ